MGTVEARLEEEHRPGDLGCAFTFNESRLQSYTDSIILGRAATSLTAVLVMLDFTPKLLDREVIRLFENGGVKTPDGRQWGYLMVFGATALRLCGFVIQNYTE